MRSIFSACLALISFFTFAPAAKADEVIFAVIEINALIPIEDLASEIEQLDLTKIAGQSRVESKGKKLRGASVVFAQRSSLQKGTVRLATYLADGSALTQYSWNGSEISAAFEIVSGLMAPVAKPIARKYAGNGTPIVGRARLLNVRQSSQTVSRSGRDGYKKSEHERTRLLLVQLVR